MQVGEGNAATSSLSVVITTSTLYVTASSLAPIHVNVYVQVTSDSVPDCMAQ